MDIYSLFPCTKANAHHISSHTTSHRIASKFASCGLKAPTCQAWGGGVPVWLLIPLAKGNLSVFLKNSTPLVRFPELQTSASGPKKRSILCVTHMSVMEWCRSWQPPWGAVGAWAVGCSRVSWGTRSFCHISGLLCSPVCDPPPCYWLLLLISCCSKIYIWEPITHLVLPERLPAFSAPSKLLSQTQWSPKLIAILVPPPLLFGAGTDPCLWQNGGTPLTWHAGHTQAGARISCCASSMAPHT
jgi:hypothetical protein